MGEASFVAMVIDVEVSQGYQQKLCGWWKGDSRDVIVGMWLRCLDDNSVRRCQGVGRGE